MANKAPEHLVCLPNKREPLPYVASAPQPEKEAARKWDFELDTFQKVAIECLERNESVLVSGHTSAGKTVVAEYAIAMGFRDKQRVIYTTPIKALSNQKFVDLKAIFPSDMVGLITGDVTINKDASFLVMTTEILRSMLYHKGGEVSEVAWVIFDEIHYLRDAERGVVWEESIILLPHHIKQVFLSATIPNAVEFGQWIADQHNQPCNIIKTFHRPVPLRHYMYPEGGDGVYLIMDECNNFRSDNFEKMTLGMNSDKKRPETKSDIAKIVAFVLEKNLDPLIVFSFARRECEALAISLYTSTPNRVHLTSETERVSANEVINAAFASLGDEEASLPQVNNMRPLLIAGIGVHHSGLIPFLREITEMLFQEGLIKVLFATETFAMGLNMPARCCVFSSSYKFDGKDTRRMAPGEYVQMSGRAGRRGLDTSGTVITIVDERMTEEAARAMIGGESSPLSSSFHLSYNMVLNTLRSNDFDPELIIQKSFHQFQLGYKDALAMRPGSHENDSGLRSLKDKLSLIPPPTDAEAELVQYLQLFAVETTTRESLVEVMKGKYEQAMIPFLCPGRAVFVRDERNEWGWGLVISVHGKNRVDPENGTHVVDILIPATFADARPSPLISNPLKKPSLLTPSQISSANPNWRGIVVPVLLGAVKMISAISVQVSNCDIRDAAVSYQVLQAMAAQLSSFHDDFDHLLHPISDLGIKSKKILTLLKRSVETRRRIRSHPMHAVVYPTTPTKGSRNLVSAGSVSGTKRKTDDFSDGAALARSEAKKPVLERRESDSDMSVDDSPVADPIPAASRIQSALAPFTPGTPGTPGTPAATSGGGIFLTLPRVGPGDAGYDILSRVCDLHERLRLQREVAKVESGLSESGLKAFRKELKQRNRVLSKFLYTTADGVVTLKGQVSCEIEICDDLTLTEMIFLGCFNDLQPEEIAALVSPFVAEEAKQEKSKKYMVLLKRQITELQQTRSTIREFEEQVGLQREEKSDDLNTSLMDIVADWCLGKSFNSITKSTQLFEGSIIRSFRRITELVTQMARAAEKLGDENLQKKFELTVERLRRGIIFASSLYS